VFSAALNSNFIWLTIIGVVNSAVAAYYYLRLIVVMYMREPVTADPCEPASPAMRLALVLAIVFTIYLGVVPGRIMNFAQQGALDLDSRQKNSVIVTGLPAAPALATPAR